MIKCADDHRLGVKKLADPVSNEIINSPHIHFTDQPFLHAVDDRQFGLVLFCFFQQVRGFVKEPRIFKGHTHAVGNSGKQPKIGFAECIFCFYILQADRSPHYITHDHRNEHP